MRFMSAGYASLCSANRRLRRFALLGLLAILLGQAALLGHWATQPHAGDEVCAICATGDRLDHSLSAVPLPIPQPDTAGGALSPPPAAPASVASQAPRARGPPARL